jgi:hypothetical protein
MNAIESEIHIPLSWQYILFYPFLKIFESFTRRRSSFWNWHPYSGHIKDAIFVNGDKNLKKKPRSLLEALTQYQPNFEWQRVLILRSEFPNHDIPYKVGFISSGGYQAICDIEVMGACAVLIGPDDVQFFGVNAKTGEEIDLRSGKFTNRKYLDEDIPLL